LTWKGAIDVSPVSGVIISDTNKINFPSGTDLSCIDITTYPGKYYGYVFRSGASNNGYFEITEVDDVNDFIRVANADFFPETGVTGDSSKVMAAVCQPIVMMNSSSTPEIERVILDAGTLGAIDEVLLIGGNVAEESASAVIIDGFDITAATGSPALRIENSGLIVYANGKIYDSDGPGVVVTGTSSLPAEFNTIVRNTIYNTPGQAVIIGGSGGAAVNEANFTHLLRNEIYSSGISSLASFENAVKVSDWNTHFVMEGNLVRDIRMNTIQRGIIYVESHCDSARVYGNIVRNLTGINSGDHYFIHIEDSISDIRVYNNLIYNEAFGLDQVNAFRINASLHSGGIVCYNTVYQVHEGFIVEDYGSTLDFTIRNNILDLNSSTYFTNLGTSGRYTVDHNIYPTVSSSYAAGNIVGDPLLISPTSSSINGLRPRFDSPVLGAGMVVPGVTTDYLGFIRDVATPTIGAFEGALLNAVWTGANGTNWHDTRNWDIELIPNAYLNVSVSVAANQPLISGSNAACRALDLTSGMQVTVTEGFVLTVGE
jgi:hypothetical protein